MKFKLLQIFLNVLVILMFFLELFVYKQGNENIPITGFNALFHKQYFIFGNLMIFSLLLGAISHVAVVFISLVKRLRVNLEKIQIPISFVSIIAAIIIVTLLGTYLTILGMCLIGIILVQVFLLYYQFKDKEKKKSSQ